ncbi:MAG: DUF1311 domain-containing protein [Rhizobiales bacterium]|nr:DUF1311 domain-containing protein [Hyphomicrobiales bacterium]
MRRGAMVGALLLLAGTGGAQAASFDCKAAKEPDEKAICASMALSDLDVRMATLYEVAGHLVAMGQRGMLQDEQREFLKSRAACGAKAACLSAAYEARIKAITGVLQSIYARGPF